MPVILALPVSVTIALVGILLASAVQTAIDCAYELAERRRKIKQLDVRVRVWTSLAAEETDPIEKGYKTARLLNLACERSILNDPERKRSRGNQTSESVRARNRAIFFVLFGR